MSKSNFNALVEAKKQRDGLETEEALQTSKPINKRLKEEKMTKKSEKDESGPIELESNNQTTNPRPSKRDTVRRSYRVDEAHDKAVKVMSKFMGQGTEEDIVLKIFGYYFENNADGKRALQSVELLQTS